MRLWKLCSFVIAHCWMPWILSNIIKGFKERSYGFIFKHSTQGDMNGAFSIKSDIGVRLRLFTVETYITIILNNMNWQALYILIRPARIQAEPVPHKTHIVLYSPSYSVYVLSLEEMLYILSIEKYQSKVWHGTQLNPILIDY